MSAPCERCRGSGASWAGAYPCQGCLGAGQLDEEGAPAWEGTQAARWVYEIRGQQFAFPPGTTLAQATAVIDEAWAEHLSDKAAKA